MSSEARTDYIDPEFAKTIEDRAKRKAANRAAGVKKSAETRARKQQIVDALVAALEHIQRHAKDRSEKAWFRLDIIADEADAALALARS